MTPVTLHATPRSRDVLAALVLSVGYALRRPALCALALVAIATLLVAVEVWETRRAIAFQPAQYILPGLLGLLLPIGVWLGEERFGAGFLWTLPVDRYWHALGKAFAGWVWLMAAIALLVLWLLAITLATGGNVLAEETRHVLPSFSFAVRGPFEPGAVQHVRWTPQPVLWLVPFTAATAAYLFASALALATRNPLRWVMGLAFGAALLNGLAEAANIERFMHAMERLADLLLYGPYGMDAVLTAKTESLQVAAKMATGETRLVWRALPDVGEWAAATFFWTAAGLLALVAGASRHRERR